MLIEYEDVGRAEARARAAHRHRAARLGRGRGLPARHAIADEDLPRETDDKTAAVHFLRFELDREMVVGAASAARASGSASITRVRGRRFRRSLPATRAALVADLA